MVFAVIGGDGRQARLCSLLSREGHEVSAFALERAGMPCCILAPGPLLSAECAVLPLPAERPVGFLNAPFSEREYGLEDVLDALPPGCVVCAGKAEDGLRELAASKGLELCDYFAREDFTVMNAAATAEGALELLLRETERTLLGANILVVGAGRIGRLLAARLRALGARVTVSSRNAGDMALCGAYGWSAADTRELGSVLPESDAVVNTVPAPVLGERELALLPRGALCLDLASAPGGVDLEAAAGLGVRAFAAPGLPGRTAPESAACYVRDAVYGILRERGLM